MKKIGIMALVTVAVVVAFSAIASAEEIIPIKDFEVVENFPSQIIAGSTYVAHYRFNCTADEPILVTMYFGIGEPDIGPGEWSVSATVNGEIVDVLENSENAGSFILSYDVVANSTNDVVIQVSSLPNVLPASYTFTLELWSETVEVIPEKATLTADTTPVKGEVFVDGSSWGTAPQTRELDAGTYTVSFGDVSDYETPASETVTLAAGETRTVTGIYTVIPAPAEFELSNLVIEPAEVETGETVTISVDVANVGGQSGSYEVKFKVEGVLEDTETVTLSPDGFTTVTFTTSREAEGTYGVEVDGLTGSFGVKKPAAFPWPVVVAGIIVVVAGGVCYWKRKEISGGLRKVLKKGGGSKKLKSLKKKGKSGG